MSKFFDDVDPTSSSVITGSLFDNFQIGYFTVVPFTVKLTNHLVFLQSVVSDGLLNFIVSVQELNQYQVREEDCATWFLLSQCTNVTL
jgi:hypothetical protein